jgi:hypothetical protein
MGAKRQMGLMQMLTGTLFTPISPLQLLMPNLQQFVIPIGNGIPFGYVMIAIGLYLWVSDQQRREV